MGVMYGGLKQNLYFKNQMLAGTNLNSFLDLI